MKPNQACVQCGVRWKQSKDGWCRRCLRETGDTRSLRELDTERAKRGPVPTQFAHPSPREARVVFAHGTLYEVVWP